MNCEEALAIYRAGPEAVVKALCEAYALLEQLQERVKALEEQLAKNSRNSSKPPSADGLKKAKPHSSDKRRKKRKCENRKPGGRKGHKGHRLKPVHEPDHTIVHAIGECKECGRSLGGEAAIDYEGRQVFDIPPVSMEGTERRAEIKECPDCGAVSKAAFAQGVAAPTQYGARLKAYAVYMRDYQFLPYKRLSEFFRGLYGMNISEGTLVNIIRDCSTRLEPAVEQIRHALIEAQVEGFDETGISVEGKRLLLHVASTPRIHLL